MRLIPWLVPVVCLSASCPSVQAAMGAETQPLKGNFFTLLESPPSEQRGFLRVTLGAADRGTALLSVGGVKCVLVISASPALADGSGRALTISHSSISGMSAELKAIALPNGSIQIVGEVISGGWRLPVTADKLVNTAGAHGDYTFILESGSGGQSGFGTLRLGANGHARLTAKFATGRPLTAGGRLNSHAVCEFVGAAKDEQLSGGVSFSSTATTDCTATIDHRVAATETTAANYQSLELSGSRYLKTANLASLHLIIEPGVAAGYDALLSSSGRYTLINPGAELPALSLRKNNGLLLGSVISGGARKALRGVVLQASRGGRGLVDGGGTFRLDKTPTDSSGGGGTPYFGSGGTLTLNGGTPTGNGSQTVGGGTLTGSGSLTFSGATSSFGGTVFGATINSTLGTFTNGTLTISSGTWVGGTWVPRNDLVPAP